MLPTAYKDGKLYSVRPTDGSGDFTFSRGSNLAATRISASQLIEKGRENLLLQSNTFDTTWTTTRATFVGGQAGYDGSNNAWAMVDNTTNSTHLSAQSLSLGASVATFSIYAKANDVDFLAVRFEGSSVDYAYFNLASGTLGTIDSDYIEARITDVGSGWYRCEATRVLAASGNQVVLLAAQANNDPTYAGAGTTALYIQDSQVELGLVATEYIETGASTAQSGILEDLPRLDYSGGASCPALLLEPQRTNKANYSEGYVGYQTSTSGTGVAPVVSQNAAVSPDGTQNAFRVDLNRGTGNTGSDWSWIYQSNIGYVGSNVISVYLKAATSNDIGKEIAIRAAGGSNAVVLTADWKRHEIIKTSTATSDLGLYSRGGENADNAVSCYVYGWQVENNSSYPTSYIPTMGSAVTRSQDVCSGAGDADTFNDSEGTLFAEIFIEEEIDSNINISVSKGTHAQDLTKFIYLPSTNEFRFEIFGGAVGTSITINNLSLGVYNKIAGSYDGSDVKLYINGVQIGTASTNQLPTGLNQFNFDRADGTAPFKGKAKKVLYFPTALTDSECIALTTI
jgi:hypothetical protein